MTQVLASIEVQSTERAYFAVFDLAYVAALWSHPAICALSRARAREAGYIPLDVDCDAFIDAIDLNDESWHIVVVTVPCEPRPRRNVDSDAVSHASWLPHANVKSRRTFRQAL